MSPKQSDERLEEFSSKYLKVKFKNLELLREALTHRSFLNEVDHKDASHNERLEFLGDAVLELISTEYLFDKYPARPEGDLTSFRAALVRTESLAEEADRLHYGDYLQMSRGEEKTGGRKRPYILANTFEAVLGAMYLDLGQKVCTEFVHRELLPKTKDIVENRSDIDPKSKLQELAQEVVRQTPTYKLISAEGPDHNKVFTMSARIADLDFGQGSGSSKQEAEQNAAQDALENWEKLYKKAINSGKITTL